MIEAIIGNVNHLSKFESLQSSSPGGSHPQALTGRVEGWRGAQESVSNLRHDKSWNYLYSDRVGLSKAGLGWVNSYLYNAESMIIYVVDSSKGVIHVGLFKWLDAGWAKLNMVNSNHILNGIKRFASDFKRILEAPGLPGPTILAEKHRQLQRSSKQNLQETISPYLQNLVNSGTSDECSGRFNSSLSSGEYLQGMSHEEMVKILMLEYLKESIPEQPTS